jgi:TolA-binding protein
MTQRLLLRSAAVLALSFGFAGAESFAVDFVYRRSSEKNVGGEVSKITRDEVVVDQQVVKSSESVPANDIDHIEWDGEPGAMKLGRGSETTGNLDEAIKQYQEAAKAATTGRDGLKAEIDFSLARATARKALRTGADLSPAISLLKAFVNSHSDHYRFFDAQLLLGESLATAKDYLTADISFQSVAGAPWPDYQMAGKIGLARSALGRGETDAAKALFDEVVASKATSPVETSRRLEAILGQAQCQQAKSDNEGSLKTLDQVIEEAQASDARLQARAFLLQGDAYRALSNAKAAVISYLRVDVIPEFSAESDLHAEALYRLATLWPTVGEPGRGAEASSRLQADYAASPWTAKLSEAATTN